MQHSSRCFSLSLLLQFDDLLLKVMMMSILSILDMLPTYEMLYPSVDAGMSHLLLVVVR